jgi:hypothetical protein
MKIIIIKILLVLSIVAYGQNKHMTIGLKENGICFGNSKTNSGLRFNYKDQNVNNLNGVNLAVVSKSKVSNGITFGLVANRDSISNGVLINGLVGNSYKINGIVISGIGQGANKINGVGIGGLAIVGDTLNGLFISPIGMTYWNTEQIKLVNGLAFGLIIGSNTKKMNGLSLSLFNNNCDTLNGVAISMINKTKELHGIQLGLWNVAANNRIFKRMPILNFNFRKMPSR